MVSRMTADGFSMDVYGAYLNSEAQPDFADSEVPRFCSRPKPSERVLSETCTLMRPSRRLGYILTRLIWLAIGPGALMVLAVLKLEARSGASQTLDSVFFAVSAAILMLRWGTWIAGDRRDSFGARMTLTGLLGFSALLATTAAAFWYLATLIALQQ